MRVSRGANPLGILLTRPFARRVTPAAIGVFNIGQALPSIGLVALFAVVWNIGFAPAVVSLVAYSALPVLRSSWGQIAIQALEAAGAEVNDKTGIQGTANVRGALDANEIDMYWEYTGTGWTSHPGNEAGQAPKGTQQLYDTVAAQDLQRNQVRWLAPAPANNAYAIATSQQRAQQLGVTTLSQYADLARRDPAQASLGGAAEFRTRDDGLPGMQQAYGFTLPPTEISEVDLGVIYTRVPSGDPCNFGEVFETDGRIIANNLQVLQDDKQFFVKYNVAMTVNDPVLARYPQLAQVFNPISARLTNETLQQMNARVDVEGVPPEQVAQEFLQQNGFIS